MQLRRGIRKFPVGTRAAVSRAFPGRPRRSHRQLESRPLRLHSLAFARAHSGDLLVCRVHLQRIALNPPRPTQAAKTAAATRQGSRKKPQRTSALDKRKGEKASVCGSSRRRGDPIKLRRQHCAVRCPTPRRRRRTVAAVLAKHGSRGQLQGHAVQTQGNTTRN